jgi:hypothetical protein
MVLDILHVLAGELLEPRVEFLREGRIARLQESALVVELLQNSSSIPLDLRSHGFPESGTRRALLGDDGGGGPRGKR